MVAYPDEVLSPQDRWALVHYIQSLRRKDVEVGDMLAVEDSMTVSRIAGELPLNPVDPRWERVDETWPFETETVFQARASSYFSLIARPKLKA